MAKSYEWTIITTDGIQDRRVTAAEPTLKELQTAVGGWIEVVRTIGGKMMILNEEGKLMGLPVNEIASDLYASPHDMIVGNVVICENFDPN